MSPSASTLPVGWSQVLDEVQLRLDHAVASADARMDRLPHFDTNAFGLEQRQAIAQWNDRLKRLHTHLESVEQVVHSVDEMLQKEELVLRQHLAKSATLRQRLADQTGRAIG